MRVISQHNLWFRGKPRYTNYKLDGRSMISVAPLLGRRDSSDAAALEQEMQWLHRYSGRDGRNFIYSLEWIRPGDLIDRNLNAVFLPTLERTEARWNIFYDPVLAVRQRDIPTELPIDFSRPAIVRQVRADLAYFWDNYFRHPAYWELYGKPVLYVWSVTTSIRNAEWFFREAREQGIYVLGDVFGGPLPVPELDGYTGFVASTPDLAGTFTDVPSVMPHFEEYYARVRQSEEHPAGDLIPALSAQYDDSDFQSILDGTQTRILATQRADVMHFLRLARRNARGVDGQRYVFFGTTNNWAEGSTILPTRQDNEPFLDTSTRLVRIGDYGFAHLEVMREVLFPDEPTYEGPRIERLANGNVRFRDCDVLGKLRLKGRVDNPPDWRAGDNLGEHVAGERLWKPRGASGVTLRFDNVDGLKTKLRLPS